MEPLWPLSPLAALSGGLMIGLAASVFVLLLGRIAGVSGLIANTILLSSGAPWAEAAAFILGLPLGAGAAAGLINAHEIIITDSILLLATAGLLVGFGTRLGSGCTSGHGVCGVARLSPRSLVATAAFMAAGFLTVFAIRHLIGG